MVLEPEAVEELTAEVKTTMGCPIAIEAFTHNTRRAVAKTVAKSLEANPRYSGVTKLLR